MGDVLRRAAFSPIIYEMIDFCCAIYDRDVRLLEASDLAGAMYLLPTPKSPHGVDIDPTGEYIVAGGKLAALSAAAPDRVVNLLESYARARLWQLRRAGAEAAARTFFSSRWDRGSTSASPSFSTRWTVSRACSSIPRDGWSRGVPLAHAW